MFWQQKVQTCQLAQTSRWRIEVLHAGKPTDENLFRPHFNVCFEDTTVRPWMQRVFCPAVKRRRVVGSNINYSGRPFQRMSAGLRILLQATPAQLLLMLPLELLVCMGHYVLYSLPASLRICLGAVCSSGSCCCDKNNVLCEGWTLIMFEDLWKCVKCWERQLWANICTRTTNTHAHAHHIREKEDTRGRNDEKVTVQMCGIVLGVKGFPCPCCFASHCQNSPGLWRICH